jgi:hypothetical protein
MLLNEIKARPGSLAVDIEDARNLVISPGFPLEKGAAPSDPTSFTRAMGSIRKIIGSKFTRAKLISGKVFMTFKDFKSLETAQKKLQKKGFQVGRD